MTNIYHYTSTSALEGILQEDGIHLRLTNVRFLNDIEETRIGYKRICKIKGRQLANPKQYSIATDKKMLDSTFTCSLSKVIDKVPLWAMYADNGAGVAIGLNASKLKEYIKKLKLGFVDCRYDPNTITEAYLDELEKDAPLEIKKSDYRNVFAENWSVNHVCIQYKAKSYDFECESRIYWVGECSSILGNPQKIEYRPKGESLVPYIEIIVPHDALSCIYIGPNHKGNKPHRSAIENFTRARGYDCKVLQSKLSYRG